MNPCYFTGSKDLSNTGRSPGSEDPSGSRSRQGSISFIHTLLSHWLNWLEWRYHWVFLQLSCSWKLKHIFPRGTSEITDVLSSSLGSTHKNWADRSRRTILSPTFTGTLVERFCRNNVSRSISIDRINQYRGPANVTEAHEVKPHLKGFDVPPVRLNH